MQTIDELKYSQSVWGFQPRKAEIRRVCDVKGLLRNRNHLDVCKDRFRQRCQIVPLVRKTLKCPDCGTEILLSSTGRERYVQGLPNGKLLTFFRLCVHQCWCHRCQKSFYESFPFLSSPKARITKALEQLILKLRLDGCLRDILGSELAPLCQLGGFIAPDGSFFRIKANFDADVSRSAERAKYNRSRSRDATRFLLEEYGLKDADVARMLSRLDAAMQGECHFHSWGFHAENENLGSLKVYVKDERPAELAFPAIVKAFSPDMAGAAPASCFRPDVLLLPFGWRYWGFYVEVSASSFRTLKFYFLVPESQKDKKW